MATALTPISDLPASAPSSLAQATQGQVAQSSPSIPQQETLPDLPRIPVFGQDTQPQPQQRQSLSTEVLPVAPPPPKADFGMKLIAAIAMGKGNFAPAFEIKQMERKGAAYSEYLQSRRQFNYLMSRGEDKKAEEVLRESSIRMLQTAPELKELVNADTERLYKKQDTAAQVQGLIVLAKNRQKRDGVDNQGFIDLLEGSGPFAHSPEALQRFLTYGGYTFAPNPSQNQTVRHTPMGTTEVIQLPYSFSEQNLKGPVGDSIVAALGFQANEIANAVNDQPVMRGKSDVGPALKQVVTPILAMARGIEAQIELVKNVPTTPEQNLSYIRSLEGKGFDDFERPLVAATRGAVPKEFLQLLKAARGSIAATEGMGVTEASQQQLVADRRRALKDAIEVEGDVPMALAPKLQNMVAVHREGAQQWLPNRNITFNQASAQPDKYGMLTDEIYTKKVIPAMLAIQDLKQVPQMFAMAGHPQDMVGRFSSAAQQLITRYLGSSDPRDAKLQVARFLAERAIEEVKNTANIPDAEVGRLKSIVTGMLAGEEAGVAGATELIREMTNKIDVYIGANSQSVTRDISKPTASTPTPTVATLNKAAGVTAKGKEKQAPDATILKVRGSIVDIIEGMDDINLPLEQSKNYQANSEQIVGNGSVTGKQMVQLMMSAQLSELRKKGVGRDELYKYVIGTDDTKEVVLSKLKAVEGLMGGGKAAPTPTTSVTPATSAPIVTPPVDTGPITLNPGVTRTPRGK